MTCVILGFLCEVDENCVLLGYYAALVMISYCFRTIYVPFSRDLEDGTDRLSWDVGKELPLYAA
jgi:hypothetical protein